MCSWNPLEDLDVDRNHLNELYPGAPSGSGSASEFYFLDDINSNIIVESHDFSLIHLNVRSLTRNGDSFLAEVCQLKFKFDVSNMFYRELVRFQHGRFGRF